MQYIESIKIYHLLEVCGYLSGGNTKNKTAMPKIKPLKIKICRLLGKVILVALINSFLLKRSLISRLRSIEIRPEERLECLIKGAALEMIVIFRETHKNRI